MKIAVIGCGHMGAGIIEGILASNLEVDLLIVERFLESVDKFKKYSNVTITDQDYSKITDYDFIIVAVRPQSAEELFLEIKKYLKNQTLISILAGVSVEKIKTLSGISSVVRIMPNLAAAKQQSMTAVYFADDSKKTEVNSILNTFGKVVEVKKEDDINLITAVSGSGIAYVFYYMQSMIEETVKSGLSEADAKEIIYQTFAGALSFGSQVSAKEFVSKIAVKGGTTEQAIKSFDENNLSQIISEGIQAALNRSRELAK